MRQLHQLPLVGLLLFFLTPSQLFKTCEVNEDDRFRLNPLLSTMSYSICTSEVQAANVLLSLRLVGIKRQNLEQKLMQEVNDTAVRKASNISSGQLAWTMMALGACHNPNETFIIDLQLVRLLEEKFQEEIENMRAHNGNPLTNYYQLSQALLALCLFSGNYSVTEIAELFTPENKNYYFGNQFSVGPLVSSNHYNESEWNCQQTLDTVLKEISQGAFNIPTAAAQILPALMGKTYLNVNKDSPCVYTSDFNASIPVPGSVTPTNSPSSITVHYSVQINETYSTNVTVPNGSVFLNVMEAAKKQNITIFGFTMEETSWGPYITSVQCLKANNNDRTYWEILSGGHSLSQGVGSYVVHNGEYLMIRWSKY